MKIEEIVAKMKEEGKSEEEIKAALEEAKKDIEAYLGQGEVPAPKQDEVHEEEQEDEKKLHEVFGI